MNNPCTNCGRQRIDGKTSKEKIGSSVITYTLTICPDSECQKIVDRLLAEKRAKTELLAKDRLKAKLAREKLLTTN